MSAKTGTADRPIVYIREARPEQLPDELREARHRFWAVHDERGNVLAVTPERPLAFALARRNDLRPHSVH
ncbi:MAG: DUF1150 family protein [Paracoccaceae bacterium]